MRLCSPAPWRKVASAHPWSGGFDVPANPQRHRRPECIPHVLQDRSNPRRQSQRGVESNRNLPMSNRLARRSTATILEAPSKELAAIGVGTTEAGGLLDLVDR